MKTLFPGGEHGFGNRRLALGDMWRVQAEGGGVSSRVWASLTQVLSCSNLCYPPVALPISLPLLKGKEA